MGRGLYTLLLACAMPLVLARLWWRGRREPGYRRHVAERFGWYRERATKPVIWVHAVSVGEVRAAAPLVRAIAERWPDCRVLVTCMTAAGRDAAEQVYGESARVAFLPYDLPSSTRRFLEWFRPRVGILMETEVWPNLIAACGEHGVPVMLANARLSEKSSLGYARRPRLFGPAFAALAAVCAQTDADAARLRERGATGARTTGNIKFDVMPDPARVAEGREAAQRLDRPAIVLASTREREEEPLLDAARALGDACAIVLVPRHPQRFDAVAALVEAAGLRLARRSTWDGAPPPDALAADVWLGDSMGELPLYYASAQVALLGGSFAPLGGQNLIEAAACGCPAVVGQHTFNFLQATADAIAAGAALRVDDADGLAAAISRALDDADELGEMRAAALRFAVAHRGATARMVALIRAAITTG